MKFFFSIFSIFAAIVLAQSGAEKEVLIAHEAFLKAARASDTASLGILLGDALVYSHSNGVLVQTKAQVIASIAKEGKNFQVKEQKVTVYGNVATIRAKIASIHPETGNTQLSVLLVWLKKGNQWQLVERQTTKRPTS